MAETIALGYQSGVFIGLESTYGTPVLATQRLPLISETLADVPTLLADMTLMGRAAGRQPDLGHRALSGAIVTQMRHALDNYLFYVFFGAPVVGVYVPILDVAGLGVTLVIPKGATSIEEYSGTKVSKVTIGWAPERVTASYDVMATGIAYDSVVNTVALLSALVDPSDNLLFTDLVFRIGERDHVLGTADEIGVTTGTLVMDRAQDMVYTNQSRAMVEPAGSSLMMGTLDFSIPRFRNQTFKNWVNAKTRLHATLTSTRNGHTRQFVIPELSLVTVGNPVASAGAIVQAVTTSLHEAEDLLASVSVSASSVDNSLNLANTSAVAATGTLTVSGTVSDGETVRVGADTYEVDTEPAGNVTAGRIRIDLSGGSTVRAQGTLTLDTQPTNGDTMTVGTQVYLFQTNGALTNVAGHIEIGTTLTNSKANLVNAVNRTGTPGTGYAATTVQNSQASIAAFSGNVATLTARKGGTAGNSVVTTETFTAGTNVFNAATLGTTTTGVNPTAAEMVTGLVLAAGASGTAPVNLVDGAGNTVDATARVAGTAGNAIVTTETLANGSWGAATLTGGTGTVDQFPLTYPGATAYLSGFADAGNNGKAPVVSWTPAKLVLGNAGAGGLTLTTVAAGASVRVVTRSVQVSMIES